MDWNQAIRDFSIPKSYHDASLSNTSLLRSEIVDLGKRWLKSKDKPALYLYGGTGVGKTYFSYALLRGLIEQKHSWLIFITSHQLDVELLDAMNINQEGSKIQKYQEVPFLFIDDLGTERITERLIRQYHQIIGFRQENRMSTVYSSNMTIDELRETLGDRIYSRLKLCYQFAFPNEDLRNR